MKKIRFIVVLILAFSTMIASAQTTTGYRMENILNQLNRTTSSNIKAALSKFTDMTNHWSKDSVGKLTYLEVIGGYSDGTFKPNQNIKVDEFIKLTVTAMGYKPEAGDKYWATPYIQIAKDEKLIGEKEFSDYKRPITRQEMAKIIVGALMTKEEAPSSHELALIRSGIRDYLEVSDTHKDSVLIAYRMGLIGGYPDRTFKPTNKSTRGEASAIIVRFLDPNMRKPAEPDMENVIILPDYHKNTHVLTPHGNQETFDMTKAMLEALEKSKGFGSRMFGPESRNVGMGLYENEAAFKYNSEHIFANKMQMALGTKTALLEGYIGSVVVYDVDAVKELHYGVLEDLFKFCFEKDYEKAMGELEKVFIAEKSSPKYFRNFTFNNRHVRFEKYENDSGFQFFISTKGYRP
ncbi:S-layer homology domain-containing protein [Alkaliphilus hydrothermalis]|uniref:SLH domain-containing protein n=1 Tax=Alkaliphilus hydrothermalis TaxID=1482730 RepID=A0ABS2NQ73_9FIRM|nr:S-layer homology domain-containing protein [Alkaliphilus hydrothermalis]MBM7615064.1 hypothetical protein [Alkaliphilus hydrothermalis]